MTKEQSSMKGKETKTEKPALRRLEGNEVSSIAMNNFRKDFPRASNVQWTRADMFDEAGFSVDGKTYKAFYDYESNLVGTTTPKTIKDLPANAQKEISTKYKDYTPRGVLLFDDNQINETDMLLYGTQFDDADNYFVELAKGSDVIVVRVAMDGDVYFFKNL